jgi:hypothetical protein
LFLDLFCSHFFSDPGSSSKGFGTGALIGLVIGSILVVALAFLLCMLWLRNKKVIVKKDVHSYPDFFSVGREGNPFGQHQCSFLWEFCHHFRVRLQFIHLSQFCDDKVTDRARAQNFVNRLRLSQHSGAPI